MTLARHSSVWAQDWKTAQGNRQWETVLSIFVCWVLMRLPNPELFLNSLQISFTVGTDRYTINTCAFHDCSLPWSQVPRCAARRLTLLRAHPVNHQISCKISHAADLTRYQDAHLHCWKQEQALSVHILLPTPRPIHLSDSLLSLTKPISSTNFPGKKKNSMEITW